MKKSNFSHLLMVRAEVAGRLHDNKSKYNHRNKCNVIMSLFLLKYIYMNFDKFCIVNGEGFTVKIDMRRFSRRKM